MMRAIVDDRIARAWAILFGMLVMATTVGGVTIVLHDRVGVTQSANAKLAAPNPAPSTVPVTMSHQASHS
jgi:hypothetical protein